MLIQLYLLRQLVLSIVFSVAGLSVIVLPTIAIQAVNKLGAPSVETVARYLPLVVAELVPYLLPMAFLLGVVATYGRLSAERELIAIQMAGIHPGRLAIPGFLVALPLSLWTDHLLGHVSPELKYEQRSLVREADVSRFIASMSGQSELRFGSNFLTWEDTDGAAKLGVRFDQQQEDGRQLFISAAQATFEVQGDLLVLRLKDAIAQTETSSTAVESPTFVYKLSELFPKQVKDRSKAKYLTSDEMEVELAGAALAPEKREEYRYEIHRRHALSVTYLLFLLLGIPTGVVLRSSTQLGAFTGAVGYAFLYYVLAMRLGKVLAATGAVAPLFAAWATNGLFLAVGLVFFVRALWR